MYEVSARASGRNSPSFSVLRSFAFRRILFVVIHVSQEVVEDSESVSAIKTFSAAAGACAGRERVFAQCVDG